MTTTNLYDKAHPQTPGWHVRLALMGKGADWERSQILDELTHLLASCTIDFDSSATDIAYDEGYREAVKWIRNLIVYRGGDDPRKPAHRSTRYIDNEGGVLDLAYVYTCTQCASTYTLASHPQGNGYKCGGC